MAVGRREPPIQRARLGCYINTSSCNRSITGASGLATLNLVFLMMGFLVVTVLAGSKSKCNPCENPDWFLCEKSCTCIPHKLRCDGYYADCGLRDFSDEENCCAYQNLSPFFLILSISAASSHINVRRNDSLHKNSPVARLSQFAQFCTQNFSQIKLEKNVPYNLTKIVIF